MFIVAIGWMYVVLMMSITEASVIAGIMTFLLYGVLPVSIILYLSGSGRRKLRRAQETQRKAASIKTDETAGTDDSGGRDEPIRQTQADDRPAP